MLTIKTKNSHPMNGLTLHITLLTLTHLTGMNITIIITPIPTLKKLLTKKLPLLLAASLEVLRQQLAVDTHRYLSGVTLHNIAQLQIQAKVAGRPQHPNALGLTVTNPLIQIKMAMKQMKVMYNQIIYLTTIHTIITTTMDIHLLCTHDIRIFQVIMKVQRRIVI